MGMKEMMSMPELRNMNYERFAREYVRNGHNATQAAKAAGYSEKTAYSQGSRLLKKVEILTRVREIEENVLAEAGITQTGIIERLKTLVEKCMDEQTYIATNPITGEQTAIHRRLDPSGANKALELLGKQLGMFGDRLEADVTQRMTEGDRRLIENLAKRIGIDGDDS